MIVILSEVVVREADDNAVEGPRVPRTLQQRFREFSPQVLRERLSASVPTQTSAGSFDCWTASHPRSISSAQDDTIRNMC
jgi:hypothetical protein